MEKNEKRAEVRHLFETELVFHTVNEIHMAKSVDISENGIRIVTEKPIDMCIQIKENGKLELYDAHLAWARVTDEGSMEYGFKYSTKLTK